MAIEIINVGTSPNDGNGDALRNAFIKCNDNFDELETTKIGGSGTDDYIPKFNGPDAIENSQIFDNGTNVGIGTNTPSSTLQVGNGIGIKNISISGAGSSLALGGLSVSFLGFSSGTISTINASGSVPLGVGTRSARPLVLGTNNAERMRIESSGNVGIGTTSPSQILHLYKSSYPVLTIQSSSYQSSLGIDTASGNLVLNNESNAGLSFNTNATEAMRITAGGNVGIGTTSPAEKLQVSGSILCDRVYTPEVDSITSSLSLKAQGLTFMSLNNTGGMGNVLFNPYIGLDLSPTLTPMTLPYMSIFDIFMYPSPVYGMLVYNTDYQQIWAYTTGGWNPI